MQIVVKVRSVPLASDLYTIGTEGREGGGRERGRGEGGEEGGRREEGGGRG